MSKPPGKIDGASIIEWAWSGSNQPFGVIRFSDGQIAHEIFGLAICKYDESDAVFRFSCDENWEAQQDSIYKSIIEAKQNLPAQYQGIQPQWIGYEHEPAT